MNKYILSRCFALYMNYYMIIIWALHGNYMLNTKSSPAWLFLKHAVRFLPTAKSFTLGKVKTSFPFALA